MPSIGRLVVACAKDVLSELDFLSRIRPGAPCDSFHSTRQVYSLFEEKTQHLSIIVFVIHKMRYVFRSVCIIFQRLNECAR